MSTPPVFSLRESFIVRIWRDSESSDVWRGQLQHVRSGGVIPIANVKNLSAELEAYLKKIEREKTGLK